MLASPLIKRIPNLTLFTLEGPFGNLTGGYTLIKYGYKGTQVGRIDIGPLPAGGNYIRPWLGGRWMPHYHLRRPGIPGQGIGRHRPWECKSTDTSWRDLW
jgi:hypothetical protein